MHDIECAVCHTKRSCQCVTQSARVNDAITTRLSYRAYRDWSCGAASLSTLQSIETIYGYCVMLRQRWVGFVVTSLLIETCHTSVLSGWDRRLQLHATQHVNFDRNHSCYPDKFIGKSIESSENI